MDPAQVTRVLLVDDDLLAAQHTRALLASAEAGRFAVAHAGLLVDAIAELESREFDAALLDPSLPDAPGLGGFIRLHAAAPNLPVLILADRRDELVALKAVHAGAADYILKDQLTPTLLSRAIHYAVERRRIQGALADERERLAVTLASIAEAVVATDAQGRITLMNPVAVRLSGWAEAEALGRPLDEVFRLVDKERHDPRNPVRLLLGGGPNAHVKAQSVLIARDGTERIISESGAPLVDPDGTIVGTVIVLRDITREREIEEELLRASKLESLGVVAGGIAHDFNNLLTSILGHISLLRSNPDAAYARKAIDEAERAARRARDLTQRLLTFSKGGAPIRRRANLTDLLRDAVRITLHGTRIGIRFEIPDNLHLVDVDEGQIGHVFANILINARQAMPEGGEIQVACANIRIGGNGSREPPLPLPAGDFVRTTIRDNGPGIAPEHLPRIFDPYFTTRPDANGLGLAAAYSVIRKHGGHITARSEPGKGTTFDIYLPAAEPREAATAAAIPAGHQDHPPATPTARRILVMDDDEVVLTVVRRMLERMGYEVETARDGEAALDRYRAAMATDRPFDAVVMDLTVPHGMGGREAIRKLLEIDPDARAIVSSGYSNDPVMAEYRLHGFRGVIAKPYDMRELRRTIEAVIAGRTP